MPPADAYAEAMAQFQSCLQSSGDLSMQALGLCGWDAGWSYGAWSALATIHAWQLVAAVSWLLSAALAILAAWLWWRQRGWRAC